MLTVESVSVWTWERTAKFDCAVPAMSDEEKRARIDLGVTATARPLTDYEQALFDALDRKAAYRSAHIVYAGPRRRGKRKP